MPRVWSRRTFIVVGITTTAGCTLLPGTQIRDPASNPAFGEVSQQGDLTITCPAVTDNRRLPNKYGHFFENINPPLKFDNVPTDAVSLAVILDGPDAPGGEYTHWLVWNIPATLDRIPEDWEPPAGVVEGGNSDGGSEYGYIGPDPANKQSYRFKAYALDSRLELPQGASKQALGEAMKGRIVAQTQLSMWYDFHTSAHDSIGANKTHSNFLSDLWTRIRP